MTRPVGAPVHLPSTLTASHTALLQDPAWMPHHVDIDAGAVAFVHWPRDAQRAATFLSDDDLPPGHARQQLPLAVFEAATLPQAGALHFVFHSAFCCSTLLARALDIPGRAMGLKEPALLNDLAELQRRGMAADRLARLIDPALRLLARPLAAGEAVIAKPSNVVNGLMPLLMAHRPAARALLMHSTLPVFLRSVAKKGLWGRRWVRQLQRQLRAQSLIDPGFDTEELALQTDLQVAGMAWLMHIAQFQALARRLGPERVRTLEGDTLLARPAATLQAVSDFFALGLTAREVQAQGQGEMFRRDAKVHERDFDAGARAQEHQRTDEAHGEEIAMVVRWVEAVALHCQVATTLPLRIDGSA